MKKDLSLHFAVEFEVLPFVPVLLDLSQLGRYCFVGRFFGFS